MKFEIEEITTSTILRQVEAENASEAEEKASSDQATIMKKNTQTRKEVRIFTSTPVSKANQRVNFNRDALPPLRK